MKAYIVHTHAKDGRHLEGQDPSFIELPLGQGDVDFARYPQALDEVGYHGFLTIEREAGDDPVGDITAAVEFLKSQIQ